MFVKVSFKDLDFEKCGDVILSPKGNIFALTCSLCNDVFLTFKDFQGHILQQHDVYLGLNSDCESEGEIEEVHGYNVKIPQLIDNEPNFVGSQNFTKNENIVNGKSVESTVSQTCEDKNNESSSLAQESETTSEHLPATGKASDLNIISVIELPKMTLNLAVPVETTQQQTLDKKTAIADNTIAMDVDEDYSCQKKLLKDEDSFKVDEQITNEAENKSENSDEKPKEVNLKKEHSICKEVATIENDDEPMLSDTDQNGLAVHDTVQNSVTGSCDDKKADNNAKSLTSGMEVLNPSIDHRQTENEFDNQLVDKPFGNDKPIEGSNEDRDVSDSENTRMSLENGFNGEIIQTMNPNEGNLAIEDAVNHPVDRLATLVEITEPCDVIEKEDEDCVLSACEQQTSNKDTGEAILNTEDTNSMEVEKIFDSADTSHSKVEDKKETVKTPVSDESKNQKNMFENIDSADTFMHENLAPEENRDSVETNENRHIVDPTAPIASKNKREIDSNEIQDAVENSDSEGADDMLEDLPKSQGDCGLEEKVDTKEDDEDFAAFDNKDAKEHCEDFATLENKVEEIDSNTAIGDEVDNPIDNELKHDKNTSAKLNKSFELKLHDDNLAGIVDNQTLENEPINEKETSAEKVNESPIKDENCNDDGTSKKHCDDKSEDNVHSLAELHQLNAVDGEETEESNSNGKDSPDVHNKSRRLSKFFVDLIGDDLDFDDDDDDIKVLESLMMREEKENGTEEHNTDKNGEEIKIEDVNQCEKVSPSSSKSVDKNLKKHTTDTTIDESIHLHYEPDETTLLKDESSLVDVSGEVKIDKNSQANISTSKKRKRTTDCLLTSIDSPKRQKNIDENMVDKPETSTIVQQTILDCQREPLSPNNNLFINLPKSLSAPKTAVSASTPRKLDFNKMETEKNSRQELLVQKTLQKQKMSPPPKLNPVVRIKRLNLETLRAASNNAESTPRRQPKSKLEMIEQKSSSVKKSSTALSKLITNANDETEDIINDILADVQNEHDMTNEEVSKVILNNFYEPSIENDTQLFRPVDEPFEHESVLKKIALDPDTAKSAYVEPVEIIINALHDSQFFIKVTEFKNTELMHDILKKAIKEINEYLCSKGKEPLQVWELKCILNIVYTWSSKADDGNCHSKKAVVNEFQKSLAYIASKKIYFCEHCLLIFNIEHKIRSHLETHTNPNSGLTCKFCLKTLKRGYDNHIEKCKLLHAKK